MIDLTNARIRSYLLASTALLALPAVAQAQSRPVDALDEAQEEVSVRPVTSVETPQTVPVAPAVGTGVLDPGQATETPQITINNNFTTTDARDPTNVTGIGQMVTDAGGGSVGLCTGTLINPRTVIFAAHCVNTRAATAYGANSGGTGIAVAFETNTRANAAGQTDELLNWLFGTGTGPGRFQTNRAQQLYNINQVFWNPLSTQNASCTAPTSCFLEADIATGVLDAPTRNVPTWTMLFSPLNTPVINPATGTGYHVGIAGYGAFGNGTTGQASGSDFRRRVAENMLGGLTSINTRNLFLFGTAGAPSRPQLLYWLDFDDPRRGQAGADPEDFNGFRDNALTREGLTGPGDSGGPLILDQTYSIRTILGVLSGGSTFFNGQPGGSYGTQSFYQPLFLYWDWIVANNPYRYVSAVAGNRNWEDATAWVTELDPAYQIIAGNQLVNGLPTNLGGGRTATGPEFGELCFQSPSTSPNPVNNECVNLATGAPRNGVPNTPTGTGEVSAPAMVAVLPEDGEEVAATQTDGRPTLDGAIESPQADPGYSDTVRPAPTLANGLPGATNFVPNNVDGVRATGVAGRYYDVTLRNAGIVTLNSNVTIDRFTVAGAQSQLTIASGATLNSLIDTNQVTGIVNANGTLNSGGDYFFLSGLLSGTGRVNAPFLTSVLGNIAPGTLGTLGFLTIGGNLVLSSGSTLAIDLGNNAQSDRLIVQAGSGQPGTASLGGRVIFSVVPGTTPRAGELFTFFSAEGGRTGTFATPAAISAILTPQLIYSATAVQARLVAGQFVNVLNTSPVAQAFGRLLDLNRADNRGTYGALYDFLDLASAATIQSTLDSWAPRAETLARSSATALIDTMDRTYAARMAQLDLDGDDYDGSLAIVGSPMQVLSAGTMAGAMTAGAAVASTAVQPDAQVQPGRLPRGVRGFIGGGYIDGDARSMATAIPFGGRDKFDGWFVNAGIEAMAGENAAIGFGLAYAELDGTTGGVAQGVKTQLYQGTLYGKTRSDSGIVLDGRLSAGLLRAKTQRAAVLGATTYDLRSTDDTLAVSSEIGLSKQFGSESFSFGPRIAARASNIGFSKTIETGGPLALAFDRQASSSAQGLAGVTIGSDGMRFKPFASAYYVHEFLDKADAFGANFIGGVGGNSLFALSGVQDRNWGEVSVGVTFGSERVSFSVGADTTVFRKDIENQAYRGSVSFKF